MNKTMDLICLSHLRWNFVYQRPQHLMSRFRKHYRVFFMEEPLYDAPSRYNAVYEDPQTGVSVITPHLPASAIDDPSEKQALLDLFISSMNIEHMILWYYTPMALEFTSHLNPELVVYDCMDELSGFKFAPPALREYEKQLFRKADVVFTGGHNLYQAKKNAHHNIHPFPSSIDKKHFEQARTITNEPEDQKYIPHPRIGFYGVIDERFDIALITSLAAMHPEWHFVVLGPVVKIDPETLPKLANVHFPGQKDYKELPQYLAGWDVAMMPFLLNEATEYISPTKTPEYLAGGKPVVSTSIKDVVKPYGELGLVEIADTPTEFADAIERSLNMNDKEAWLEKVDAFLADTSWNKTWQGMENLIQDALDKKKLTVNNKNSEAYV
jgi:UDP-galactopyranose mutase